MSEGNDRVTTREFYDRLIDVEHRIMDKLDNIEQRTLEKIDDLFPCDEVVRLNDAVMKHEERLDSGDRSNKIIVALGGLVTAILTALR